MAPDGCTQYFFGETTDIVKTFNFSGGQHLASQDQNICVRYTFHFQKQNYIFKWKFNVRRERNICEICWATTAEGDFELTGSKTGPTGKI